MRKKKFVLLLTACISPKGMSYTVLQDPVQRKNQYESMIDYYLETTSYKIVFCNNSGDDINEWGKKNPKRLEVLSFAGNEYDKSLGKGYGELNIIRYAFEHSDFIKKCVFVIKITGRLKVQNLQKLIGLTDFVLFYPYWKVYVLNYNAEHYSDSRCFVANKSFFYSFIQKNLINDSVGYYFECQLFDEIISKQDQYFISEFCYPLYWLISGMSGSTGTNYIVKNLNLYGKLQELIFFCELKKNQVKSYNKLLCIWILIVLFFFRIIKFIVRVFHV
ncbi:MAG: hypothetical protein M0P12_09120 [Paludibacteraceae bacterium]|nr:hypothetical protein [Paludibacteraceae bacterium]